MAGKGGYQKPANPAPVSGPGALSKRTDGGPGAMQGSKYIAGLPYGEGQEFQDMQQMAPMSAAAPTPSGARAAVTRAAQSGGLTPLSAPSQRPDEPVTAGAALGTGPGVEALGIGAGDQQQNDLARARLQAYRPVLMYIASRPDTSADTRNYIKQLVGD